MSFLSHLQTRCGLAAGLLLALAACGGGDDDPVPAPFATHASGLVVLDGATSCALPAFQASLLAQINQARASARSCGDTRMPEAPGLEWEERLFSAAARHADDMARMDYFAHAGLDGRSPGQRVTAEGYGWHDVGENIAAGQTTASRVMAAWLASPGHCANLMRREYTEVGVACVVAPPGSTYSHYWAMVLARP